jgi:shikimate kinase
VVYLEAGVGEIFRKAASSVERLLEIKQPIYENVSDAVFDITDVDVKCIVEGIVNEVKSSSGN